MASNQSVRVRLSPTRLGCGETGNHRSLRNFYSEFESQQSNIALSSNGRMLVSETSDLGSSPSGATLGK